jgi:hypothetical protein
MWTEKTGLASFPGGGLSLVNDSVNSSSSSFNRNLSRSSLIDGSVHAFEFEPKSQSLFVAGAFRYVNGMNCSTVAVWEMSSNTWTCLYDPSHGISSVTAMLYSSDTLYLAGWAAPSSSWDGKVNQTPYTIARLDVSRYVEDRFKPHVPRPVTTAPSSQPSSTPASNSSSPITWSPFSANNSIDPDNYSYRRRRLKRKILSLSVQPPRRSLRRFPDHYRHRRHRTMPYTIDGEVIEEVGVLSRKRLRRLSATYPTPIFPIHPGWNYTAPTAIPTKGPWALNWTWLPGFPGGNGPILRMMMGEGEYEGCLFISGAFNNLPAVTAWSNDPIKGPSIVGVGPGEQLRGLITAIRQVSLPTVDLPPSPLPAIVIKKDARWAIILLACIAALILVGLGFTIGIFRSKSFLAFSYQALMTESQSEPMISLKTLSGDNNEVLDFKECFERAMKARHLPTHENLLVINPKHVLLSKIIGEGSFGRVWSGKWGNNKVAVKEFVFAQAAMAGGSLQRDNIIEEIVGEAGIMSFLRHPKILQIYGCSLTMQAIWIVSELCDRGSLRMLLNDKSIGLTLTKKVRHDYFLRY